ncbi:hypothetical protein ARHIZOSPH14_28080 [Agromyces rhizosphaerae]|uniref:Uncharacterized protein n=1 Tax=Agromyces rhizosphaerae TaxID=88374 RepID=A0A9W6CYY5_9MICO|nr:hypothetical protein [Agromyces rhizosphaerae]GLI28566.1 hypothetical protein ARHIZOSPH14_28080 [Agromyces rhizosphaerae]
MDTALYFPYIRVPQSAWFSQVLLYWDQAATIVPREMISDPENLDPYMRELQEARLLTLLEPENEIWEVREDAFSEGFLRVLGERQIPDTAEKRSLIHAGKVSHELFSELEDRGLAAYAHGPEWSTWYEVESSTAEQYMAYLAAVMSAKLENSLPVTDRSASIAAMGNVERPVAQSLAELRYAVVNEALPTPLGPVPPNELRDFKEKYHEELRRCRVYLDGQLADVAAKPTAELQVAKLKDVNRAIEDDVAKLVEQMNRRRWPRVAFRGFGAVAAGVLTGATAVAIADTALMIGLAVGAGVINFGTLAHRAVEMAREPRFDPRAPLVYAALGSKQ